MSEAKPSKPADSKAGEPKASLPWARPVGELALIIAGVLIALWIEEWRQARIDLATQTQYLQRLSSDITEDIADLERQLGHIERRTTAAGEALEFIDSERQEGDREIVRTFNRAGFISFFRHNSATVDDLLSTGNLRLIKNKELLREISDYYRSTDFLFEFDDAKKEWIWMRYRLSLDDYIPSIVVADIAGASDSDLAAIDWSGLKRDGEMRTGLGRIMGIAGVEKRFLNRVLNAARQLHTVIDVELNGPDTR